MPHTQLLRMMNTSDGWNLARSEVEVGILIFDVEHRAILDHLHRIYQDLNNGSSPQQARQSLARLVDVTEKHFAHEEDYMRMLSYPAYHQHADDHQTLHDSLKAFVEEMLVENASSERKLARVSAFFRQWLLDHILDHDHPLANFLAQKGIR